MNYELIKQSIQKLVALTKEDWETLSPYIQNKTFSKGEALLQQGEVCRSIFFIISGTVVYYQLTEKGEEVTTDFAFEGDWVTDNRSRISKTPSHISIKALEDTQTAYILQNDLEILFRKVPAIERLARLLIESAYVKLVQMSIDLQILSAEERYQKLAADSPQAFQRLPLYHIANYLGIA